MDKAAIEFPAVVLTGPRQSGKTTLLRHRFGKTHRYIALDLPDVRLAAKTDPRSFLASIDGPVILDEVQNTPELLPYLRERIDENRRERGRFLLSGSRNLLLLEQVTESLAGRVAWLTLWPLTQREISARPGEPFPWDRGAAARKAKGPTYDALWDRLLRGTYPEPTLEPDRDLGLWHESYIRTYLERDVRGLRQIGDLTQFQSFLRVLAARSAQLLSLSGISRDLGIAVNTVKAWLSILEATHQIIVLRPFFANVSKRLVKTPKVFFADTGTLCRLCGLSDAMHLRDGPMAGHVLETAVLGEILKTTAHRGETPRITFFRTSDGHEVDFVVETASRLVPIEVKSSATPHPGMATGIRNFRKLLGSRAQAGYVVHPGDLRLPLGEDAEALPFREL